MEFITGAFVVSASLFYANEDQGVKDGFDTLNADLDEFMTAVKDTQ